ncbi:MAG TPA: aspartate 1-decarboxylase [Ignavibacteriaceae bacterium]
MILTVLKSKIHRATVTGADLNYEGSIAIDKKLIEAANFNKFERVEIYNISNGERFATYVIEGKDGEISLNGAAARLVQKGDLIIIACYAQIDEKEIKSFLPKIVLVDKKNKVINKA